MLMEKLVAVISIWLIFGLLVLVLFGDYRESRERLMSRMLFGLTRKTGERKGAGFIKRFARSVVGLGTLLVPERTLMTLQDRIDAAGNPWHLTAAELTGVKTVTGAGAGIVTGYLIYLLDGPGIAVVMGIIVFLLFQILPSFFIGRAITRRRMEMESQLPDFMDIVTLSVESGLGLDAAIATAVNKFTGPVAAEFTVALREINYGIPRRTALLNIADRNKEVKSLRNVLVAMVQAERFGMSMGAVLRVQSDQLRLDKRSRVEEAVQKLPIKMMFPLVFLIMPALFTVILGPGAISLIASGVF